MRFRILAHSPAIGSSTYIHISLRKYLFGGVTGGYVTHPFHPPSSYIGEKVRKIATQCASKIFHGIQHLSCSKSDRYLWGFLAISVDNEIEVQNAAVEALLDSDKLPESRCFKMEVVARLIHKFVSSALHSIRSLQKTTKTTTFEGFSSSPDMSALLAALEGVIHLQLVSTSTSILEAIQLEIVPDLVPLLVSACAALLEQCELSRDRSGANEVSHLLRSLGSSKYRQYVISMIASQSYDGASIARWHKASGFIDDDIADLLEKVEMLAVLKSVSIALESETAGHVSPHTAVKNVEIDNLEEGALGHIIEALQIPSELIGAIYETRDNIQARNFINSSYYYLKIAGAVMKGMIVDSSQVDLVQGLLLSCAAIASADNDAETTLSWVTKGIQDLADEIVRCLGTTFSDVMALGAQVALKSTKLQIEAGSSVERLILILLPDLIPKLKSHLRDHLSKNDEGNFGTSSSSVSLESSIIAGHQLYWCLKQVVHPHLGQACTIIMPCALMALDHYSPHIKRQAMKLFIHLTDNLNPSELRWYKDAILDCITRNIIGSGELWPLLVRTAVPLVICIEGNNPRARWYRNILNEMLGELERHQLDSARFKIWLQYVDKLFAAMGLLLVAHFKRLLPLLFPWLHTSDDSITLLVLNSFNVIIKHTWPRMPFHVERFWKELENVYKESFDKKMGSVIRSSVIDTSVLLQICGGPAFELVWKKDERESSTTCLGSALVHHLSGQTAELQLA